MALEDALSELESSLRAPEAMLTTIRKRLTTHYETRYPITSATAVSSTRADPSDLLHRLRTLQTSMPVTRDALLALQHSKRAFATSCTTLSANRALAQALLPVAAPDLDVTLDDAAAAPDALAEALQSAAARRDRLLADAASAHARFLAPQSIERFDPTALDIALLHAAISPAVPAPARPAQAQAEVVVDENKPPVATGRAAGLAGTPGKKKAGKPTGNARMARALSGGSEEVLGPAQPFRPVQKAAYNRLPRNLKLRAGKLMDVNDMYEKVFAALMVTEGPLSDKEMLAAAGVDDIGLIEVLRGLSVVSRSREGWRLPESRGASAGGRTRASLRERN